MPVRDVLSAQQTHNSNISPTGTDTTPADYTTHRHTAMMTKTTLLLLALATGTVVEATLQIEPERLWAMVHRAVRAIGTPPSWSHLDTTCTSIAESMGWSSDM